MNYDVFHGLFIGFLSIINFSFFSVRMLYIIPWKNCQQYYRSKLSHTQRKVKHFTINKQSLNVTPIGATPFLIKFSIVYKSGHIFILDNQYELNKNFILALKFIALPFFVCFDMLLSLAWLSSDDPATI